MTTLQQSFPIAVILSQVVKLEREVAKLRRLERHPLAEVYGVHWGFQWGVVSLNATPITPRVPAGTPLREF